MAHQVKFDPRHLAPGPPFRVIRFHDPVVRQMQPNVYHHRSHHPHKHHVRRPDHKLYDIEPLKVNPVKLSKIYVKPPPLKSRVRAAKALQADVKPLNRDRPQIAMHRPKLDRYEKNGILPFLSHDRGSMLPFISPSDEVLPFVHSVLHSGSGILPFIDAQTELQTKGGTEAAEPETEATERVTEATESDDESSESDDESSDSDANTTISSTYTTLTWFRPKTTKKKPKTKGTSATSTPSTQDPDASSFYFPHYGYITARGYPTVDWWKVKAASAIYHQFAVALGLDVEPQDEMEVYGQIRPIPRPQKRVPDRKPLRSKTKRPRWECSKGARSSEMNCRLFFLFL